MTNPALTHTKDGKSSAAFVQISYTEFQTKSEKCGQHGQRFICPPK